MAATASEQVEGGRAVARAAQLLWCEAVAEVLPRRGERGGERERGQTRERERKRERERGGGRGREGEGVRGGGRGGGWEEVCAETGPKRGGCFKLLPPRPAC